MGNIKDRPIKLFEPLSTKKKRIKYEGTVGVLEYKDSQKEFVGFYEIVANRMYAIEGGDELVQFEKDIITFHKERAKGKFALYDFKENPISPDTNSKFRMRKRNNPSEEYPITEKAYNALTNFEKTVDYITFIPFKVNELI